MHSDKDPTGSEPPHSASLAALVTLIGILFWYLAIFFWRVVPAVGPREEISPLGRLILFGTVGTLLLAAGLHGLWRSFGRHGRQG